MKKAARGACGGVVLDHFIQPAFQPAILGFYS